MFIVMRATQLSAEPYSSLKQDEFKKSYASLLAMSE